MIYNERKRKKGDTVSATLAELTEKLVSISDFSQGKAGKIFSDVAESYNRRGTSSKR